MPFFVYFLRCRDGSLYCGYTANIEKRVLLHNAGRASKYTKPRRPVRLVFTQEFKSKSEALKREYELKQLSKQEKEALVLGNNY